VIRVFPSGEPGEAQKRLAFLGATGDGLERFLRDLRALIVAIPRNARAGSPPREELLLACIDGKGIPHLRIDAHLLLSVSSIEPVEAARAESPEGGTLLAQVCEALRRYSTTRFRVPIPGGALELSGPPVIMGIVNVTPDSFSDGGSYRSPGEAVERALAMEEEGAGILDVGGESTRPGSSPVPVAEELRRVIPVVRGLAAKSRAIVSVDTTKAAVAREAAAAGARIVNDTSALADDPGMADAVRETGCAVVLMHRRGTPATMQRAPHYDSLFDELLGELAERMEAAVGAGIDRERILLDPGIGFGKRLMDNLALHRRLPELRVLGRPVVFGPSRKAFLGTLTDARPERRQFGTAASVAASVLSGAHVLRVHDVKEMREVVQVAAAIRGAEEC